MSNDFYNHATYPAPNSAGSSAAMRAELELIKAGFDKMPTLTGNGYKVVGVNAAGTALISDPDLMNVDFSTSNTASGAVGRLTWNDTDGTLDLGLKGGNVTLKIGQEQNVRIYNETASGFTDMQVVRVTGSSGTRLTADLAQANAENTSASTLAIMAEPAASHAEGFATTFGLIRQVNTSAFSEGATLYLSPSTAGGITTTRPTAPNHTVILGWCFRSHATQGQIYVNINNGYELEELHDVLITSVANNNMLRYNSSSGVWQNIAGPAGAVVGTSDTQTLTNKTFSGGTINGASIIGLSSPTNSGDAATKGYVDTGLALKLNLAGGTMSGAIAMGTNKITGLGNPTADQDAATKIYVDNAVQGLDAKASVRVATTENITLSNTQVIDGVTVAVGDRVLVKDQSTAANNGIYLVASGSWTRATDADAWTELVSAFVFVESGTANGNNGYTCTVAAGGTLGSTAITWVQFSGAGQITAGAGLTKSGNTLNVGTASSARIVVNSDNLDLATTGVTAGSYALVTVDAYGRVTTGSLPTTISGFGITDAYTKTEINTSLALKLNLSGGTMSGAIAMGGNKVTGLGAPTTDNDAVTLKYVSDLYGSTASAASSAAAALVSQNAAAASASAASTSEGNALTYKNAAAASASAASTSETNAASSATAASASYDAFDDRYLGAKSTAPAVDNDGNALITGALYFDTTLNSMRVYDGSVWMSAGSSVNGTSRRYKYVATAGQTTFSGVDANGATLAYDPGYIDIYMNGVRLDASDYTATSGSTFVLGTAATLNDEFNIVCFGTFAVATHVLKSGDTMTGLLTLPNIAFSGTGGRITGDFSNSTVANRVMVQSSTTNGQSRFGVIPNGTSTTSVLETFNSSDPTNASIFSLTSIATEARLSSGITGTGTYLPITVYAGGSERARFDTAGNFGLGVTPSSWGTTGTVLKALEIAGAGVSIAGVSGRAFQMDIQSNAYYNAGWKFASAANYAAQYEQYNGNHAWFTSNAQSTTAGSAITFSQTMGLDSSGKLHLGQTTGFGALNVQGLPTTGYSLVSTNDATLNYSQIYFANSTSGGYTYLRGDGRSTGYLAFGTNDAERMRIDSSGRLMLGLTDNQYGVATIKGDWIGGKSQFGLMAATSGASIGTGFFNSAGSRVGYLNFDTNTGNIQIATEQANGYFSLWTVNSERMRVDASGNMLVGPTGFPTGGGYTGGLFGNFSSMGATSRNTKPVMWGAYSTSAGLPQYLGNWASGGSWGIGPHSSNNDSILRLGTITADGSGAYWTGSYAAIYAGAYTNASDYRIKENVTNVGDGVLAKVMALRVVSYNVIQQPDEDGEMPPIKDEVGFIAHEVQEQFPVLVSGEKDAIDGEGNPQHQGVDYAKLTAYLTKAMQEQQALITQLQADVAALKA
jgi:hypothetical protein